MSYTEHKNTTNKSEVRAMFNSIARRYDFLNHFLSLGIDVSWRRKLIRELKKYHPEHVIDIATGTADLAIMAAHKGIPAITGVDLSPNMLDIGRSKIEKVKLQNVIDLQVCDAEELPFEDESFDAAIIAFGIRNFENLEKGLIEISRVLKKGAPFLILEFSTPHVFPVKQLYKFYSNVFLPLIGKIISKNDSAYTYLPKSIAAFPYGKEMIEILECCSFEKCSFRPLTFQIATIYVAVKK